MATNQDVSENSIMRSSDDISPQKFGVVAAIDFGTSSSGFAFGFLENGSTDIKLADIQLNKWQLGSASISTDKAPTTVLLKADKTFDSFGFKAEDKFAKLADTKSEKGWRYFQQFKMELYKTEVTRGLILRDAEDKPMPAKEVFAAVIAHLKTCIIEEIKRQSPSIRDEDVMYVLTVPAIWSDAAKQFMREAAMEPKVGINDEQLKLVLEPEAASVFCRSRKRSTQALDVGHRYIIIDLGGGTADIATHKVIEHEQLIELDYPRGDNLGGQLFNEEFIIFLGDLLGNSAFKRWACSKHGDHLRLLRTIEGVKWQVADSDEDVIVELPYSLVKEIESTKVSSFPFVRHDSVEKRVSQSEYSTNIKIISTTQLQIKNAFLKVFFKTIVEGVIKDVKDVVMVTQIDTVFLVGGLAKSGHILRAVQKAFPNIIFIVPEEPGVAVLKGAVLLGNKPRLIAGRVAKYSYGISVSRNFVEGKHEERYKFNRDGQFLCKNIFKKLITKGRVLKYNDVFTTTMRVQEMHPENKHGAYTTGLYLSTCEDPLYVTDPGCVNLGGIRELPPVGGWPDSWESEIKIVVDDADFQFHITDSIGRKYVTLVDFLTPTESQ